MLHENPCFSMFIRNYSNNILNLTKRIDLLKIYRVKSRTIFICFSIKESIN